MYNESYILTISCSLFQVPKNEKTKAMNLPRRLK